MLRIYPTKRMDYSILNADEKKIIDKVIKNLKIIRQKMLLNICIRKEHILRRKRGISCRFLWY